MVVDYFILRKQQLDVNELYDKESRFKGINWAAIIAIAIGSVCSLLVLDMSWYVSLIPTGLAYFLLMKFLPTSERFRKGTILE